MVVAGGTGDGEWRVADANECRVSLVYSGWRRSWSHGGVSALTAAELDVGNGEFQ